MKRNLENILALQLLACALLAAGCSHEEGVGSIKSGLRATEGSTDSRWAPAEIDVADARRIASGFVRHQAHSLRRREWAGAQIGNITTFTSPDSVVQAYECQVLNSRGNAQGWVMVEAWRAAVPISAFASEGQTQASALMELAAKQAHASAAANGDSTYRFFWAGPSNASIAVDHADGKSEVLGLGMSPPPRFEGAKRVRQAQAEAQRIDDESKRSMLSEFEEMRQAYATDDFSSTLLIGARRSMQDERLTKGHSDADPLSRHVGSGSSSFSHFIQEMRTWRNSASSIYRCNTGCTPVAFGMILEYWDRNGYPQMISTASDNSNTVHTDPDVVWMLDELRWNLRTACDTMGNGGTLPANLNRVQDHVNSRGVGTWRAETLSGSSAWSALQNEINASRPAAVHYDVSHSGGTINHSAAAYEYVDNWGSSNDWICAEKGWYPASSGIATWDCFTTTQAGDYLITTLKL